MWDIEVYYVLSFFIGLFLFAATVSFLYFPLHPSWALLQERSFQAVAGEEQTMGLALCFPIPNPANKGEHSISETLRAWQFSSVCENCRDKELLWINLGAGGTWETEWEGDVAAIAMTLWAIGCFEIIAGGSSACPVLY